MMIEITTNVLDKTLIQITFDYTKKFIDITHCIQQPR